MDIQERAEKYASENMPNQLGGVVVAAAQICDLLALIEDAYLAGSRQTQKDYVAHITEVMRLR